MANLQRAKKRAFRACYHNLHFGLKSNLECVLMKFYHIHLITTEVKEKKSVDALLNELQGQLEAGNENVYEKVMTQLKDIPALQYLSENMRKRFNEEIGFEHFPSVSENCSDGPAISTDSGQVTSTTCILDDSLYPLPTPVSMQEQEELLKKTSKLDIEQPVNYLSNGGRGRFATEEDHKRKIATLEENLKKTKEELNQLREDFSMATKFHNDATKRYEEDISTGQGTASLLHELYDRSGIRAKEMNDLQSRSLVIQRRSSEIKRHNTFLETEAEKLKRVKFVLESKNKELTYMLQQEKEETEKKEVIIQGNKLDLQKQEQEIRDLKDRIEILEQSVANDKQEMTSLQETLSKKTVECVMEGDEHVTK